VYFSGVCRFSCLSIEGFFHVRVGRSGSTLCVAKIMLMSKCRDKAIFGPSICTLAVPLRRFCEIPSVKGCEGAGFCLLTLFLADFYTHTAEAKPQAAPVALHKNLLNLFSTALSYSNAAEEIY